MLHTEAHIVRCDVVIICVSVVVELMVEVYLVTGNCIHGFTVHGHCGREQRGCIRGGRVRVSGCPVVVVGLRYFYSPHNRLFVNAVKSFGEGVIDAGIGAYPRSGLKGLVSGSEGFAGGAVCTR